MSYELRVTSYELRVNEESSKIGGPPVTRNP